MFFKKKVNKKALKDMRADFLSISVETLAFVVLEFLFC